MTTTKLAKQYNKSTTTIARWFRTGKLLGRRSGERGKWRVANSTKGRGESVNNQMRKGESV